MFGTYAEMEAAIQAKRAAEAAIDEAIREHGILAILDRAHELAPPQIKDAFTQCLTTLSEFIGEAE
jgi:hypothetical protein